MKQVIIDKLRQLKNRKNGWIEFDIKQGSLRKVVNHSCFQTRADSTIRMVADALKISPWDGKINASFRVYTGDFSSETPEANSFYYCGNSNFPTEVLFPDFIFDAWPQAGIERYAQTCQSIAEVGNEPAIHPKLLWIGNADTHPNRTVLLDIAKQNRQLMDCFNTSVDQFVLNKEKVPYISLPDHAKYKYLIDIEGRGYSGRLAFLLFSKRVLFIQERIWEQYYLRELVPNQHFVPVKNDLSDLVYQILRMEDLGADEYTRISHNAFEFAQRNLTYECAIRRIREQIENISKQ